MAGPCEIRRVELQVAEDKRVTPNSCRNPTNLRYLLSNSERLHLGLYETLWEEQFMTPACDDPNAIFHLGDNPLQRMSWSANGKIPAFRKSSGRYWHAASHRWLTDNERLVRLILMGPSLVKECISFLGSVFHPCSIRVPSAFRVPIRDPSVFHPCSIRVPIRVPIRVLSVTFDVNF
jgi:hypothetical protein